MNAESALRLRACDAGRIPQLRVVFAEHALPLSDGMAFGVDRGAEGHGGQVLFDRYQALLCSLQIDGIQGCDGLRRLRLACRKANCSATTGTKVM